MVNDTDKLSAILPYIRAMDEETKKRLDRLRQANGSGAGAGGMGYGDLLDRIYEVHARFQKDKDEQCKPLLDKVRFVEEKIQGQCAEEINKLVDKTMGALRRS